MNIILCARCLWYDGRIETVPRVVFLVVARLLLMVVRLAADRGDRRQTEMCADRPWSEPPGVGPRVRVVDAPPGSSLSLLCGYCGEKDKGDEAKFWYTSHR